MSLWEKWERENLEKQGIKVERPRDVEIRDAPVKTDWRRQTLVVIGAAVLCGAAVYGAMVVEAVANGRAWSDTYIVRLFAERAAWRESNPGGP